MNTKYDDVVIACADLVGRAGASGFEIGYLHDDVPVEDAGWYAHAQYRGARITVEDHRSPTGAALALAERLLSGATCRCRRLVALPARTAPAGWSPRPEAAVPSAIAKVDASTGWPACPACIHRHRPNTPCPPIGVWLVLTLCHRCDADTETYCARHRDRHLTVVATPDTTGLAEEGAA